MLNLKIPAQRIIRRKDTPIAIRIPIEKAAAGLRFILAQFLYALADEGFHLLGRLAQSGYGNGMLLPIDLYRLQSRLMSHGARDGFHHAAAVALKVFGTSCHVPKNASLPNVA
jgi:hypothetical protein